ncbi:MAG: hypothetical protein A3J63_00920 [Candidatus Moranbacteria bacterium RIFCSPHIGHO2_02_FULL_40_12b]|nr:MAG: hypothetical protein A3J63_00920 [Candidatus Moranbacteria bacterium RIFCSPHIGHO2_02_FULL_40_12b]OGI23790.1 MAG: hypothetical protein A3E91_00930 [Candidatus Moranbacteria bacterium RIFCSPHIGHO2_12_FULL_40_10]
MANILDKLAEEVDKIKDTVVEAVSGKEEKKPTVKTAKTKKIQTDEDEEKEKSEMGKLLEKNPVEIPKIGDVISGTVIDIAPTAVLLDLGPMGTGVVIGREAKDGLGTGKLKKGDKVSATLVDFENEDGLIELSIREASHGKAWDDLDSRRDTQEVMTTRVTDANKGGLMVEINGVSGFLPVSQLSSEHYPRVEDGDKNKILAILKNLVGKELKVRIINSDRLAEKLIVSEKAAQSEKEKAVISELKEGDVIEGEVSGVVDFGAFIKFLPPSKKDSEKDSDKLEGLVHISELAWQLIDNPREIVKVGDKVKAKIIGIDETRISLSLKALEKDPWTEIDKKYKVGDIVSGKIDKINPFGAFVYLDEDIHGLAHVSEFRDVFPGKKMDEILEAEKSYNWKILSIEPKEHRMGLMFAKKDKETKVKEPEKKKEKEKEIKEENQEETKKEKTEK